MHVYSFLYTHSCILIHKFSIIYSCTYTHSCILIHKYLIIYSCTYTHSRILITCFHFWLYVIIIVYHLTTLCVHHIFPFMFTFMFQFVFIFIFHNHFHVSCLLHMALHILVKYDVKGITPHSYIVFLYEFNLLRKWKQSNRIIQTKVMAFSCKTSRFTRITLETVRITNFSGALTLFLTQGLCTNLKLRC